jgi:hypothetical protein
LYRDGSTASSRARAEEDEPGESPIKAVTHSLGRAMELIQMFAKQHGVAIAMPAEKEKARWRLASGPW